MPRFFVTKDRISDDVISIIGEDAHHIARSLRMAIGEKISVCDMQGNEYDCEIFSFCDDKEVNAKIISTSRSDTEPKCYVRLFQGLPKGDKLDTIIQKAVECGVSEIIPFQSERCVVKIKDDAEARKTERRQRISTEAAKQCGRGVIPQVRNSVDFDKALEMSKDTELCLFCYEGDGTEPIGKLLRAYTNFPKNIDIFIGSEGGFSVKEAEKASANGAKMVGLGKRILRTETASGFALACIMCVTEL